MLEASAGYKRVAVFIDVENLVISPDNVGLPVALKPIMDRIREEGHVRGYGDWAQQAGLDQRRRAGPEQPDRRGRDPDRRGARHDPFSKPIIRPVSPAVRRRIHEARPPVSQVRVEGWSCRI